MIVRFNPRNVQPMRYCKTFPKKCFVAQTVQGHSCLIPIDYNSILTILTQTIFVEPSGSFISCTSHRLRQASGDRAEPTKLVSFNRLSRCQKMEGAKGLISGASADSVRAGRGWTGQPGLAKMFGSVSEIPNVTANALTEFAVQLSESLP